MNSFTHFVGGNMWTSCFENTYNCVFPFCRGFPNIFFLRLGTTPHNLNTSVLQLQISLHSARKHYNTHRTTFVFLDTCCKLGTQTNVFCFRRVLPTRVKALCYLRVQQTTTLSQYPSVEAQLASHKPRKINEPQFKF